MTIDWYDQFYKKPKKINELMKLQIQYYASKQND